MFLYLFFVDAKIRERSHERRTYVKTSFFHMTFHFGYISKRPVILMDICRHFILGSVHLIFYHPKWNLISVKMIAPAMSFKRACALNPISNESALIHFVSGKFCSPIWNPYHFEFHFASIYVNTSKDLTEHQCEIFNRIKISYRFEFFSPLM